MAGSETTKQKLLDAARRLFWDRGFSNVSVRDIARAAQVDAALVSRYFGSKKGLFQACISGSFVWPEVHEPGADVIEMLLAKQFQGLGSVDEPSMIKMMVMNVADPEVGEFLRQEISLHFTEPVARLIGPPAARERLAMIMAVLIGAAVVRHDIQAPGMADCSEAEHRRQLRHLVDAAAQFGAMPGDKKGSF